MEVEEIEWRAAILLGPYREDEHLARVAAGVTVRANQILAIRDVPIPEHPVPPSRPPKGQRSRGKRGGLQG